MIPKSASCTPRRPASCFRSTLHTPARALFSVTLVVVLAACGDSGDPVELFRAGEFARAFAVFSERADGGDLEAVNYLGIHYYLGAGVGRDFERAASYFEQAALAGNADAQRNIAIMYMRGLGVKHDNHRAYGWFFQAYRGGNRNAREYLRVLSDNVTPNAGGKAREWAAQQVRDYARQQPAAGRK